ncbi:MAG: hypothetical protein L3J43_04325 [Sulfurovum sp.]|nr:hypothetical protein [Sulfurovum sp.]
MNTFKKILMGATVVAFTACGGGGAGNENTVDRGSVVDTGSAENENVVDSVADTSSDASGGAANSGTRLKSITIIGDNYKNETIYEYDGNKVIKSTGKTIVDNKVEGTQNTTWEYKNNQSIKYVSKDYDKDKKLMMTTTSVTSYDKEKRPYKSVTFSTQGESTQEYTKTILEFTKWEGRYPTEEKMTSYVMGRLFMERTWNVKINNDRVETMDENNNILNTYTYDAQDRKEALFYLLMGDTEKYGERQFTHEKYLVTNVEIKNISNNKTINRESAFEFNEIGLVQKDTADIKRKEDYILYTYEEF